MVRVRPVSSASDFDRIAPNVAIWHGYDPSVKADLCSTCLLVSDAAYLVDPIALRSEAFDELIGSAHVAGIIGTNFNHQLASVQFAAQFSPPIFARSETFADQARRAFASAGAAAAINDSTPVSRSADTTT